MNNQRRKEKKQLLFIIILAIIIGVITGYYWQFLLVVLGLYSVWMLNKLLELDTWMSNGRKLECAPYVGGLWGRVVNHILRINKELSVHNKRYQQLIVSFNEVLRTFPYPIIVINAKNEITWISKRSAKIIGLNRKKDIGLRINHIIRYAPFQSILNKPDADEFQIKSPKDHNITLAINISPLYKDTRLLSIKDVSKRKQLDELKNTFIANASNELKTPITAINNHLSQLNNDKGLSKQVREIVKKSYIQSQKMSTLIDDLLVLTKLENNNNKQDFSLINLSNYITNTIKKLPNGNPELFDVKLDDTLTITCIIAQIESLLLHLLENSIKYNYHQGRIGINWQQVDGKGVLSISNQIKTMAQEKLTHLTEPFYRLHNAESDNSTGLGLSIVHQIVKNHQASLSFKRTINAKGVYILTVNIVFST